MIRTKAQCPHLHMRVQALFNGVLLLLALQAGSLTDAGQLALMLC